MLHYVHHLTLSVYFFVLACRVKWVYQSIFAKKKHLPAAFENKVDESSEAYTKEVVQKQSAGRL